MCEKDGKCSGDNKLRGTRQSLSNDMNCFHTAPSHSTITTRTPSRLSSFPTHFNHASRREHQLRRDQQARIALGLKPLTDEEAPVDSTEERLVDNYTKQREKKT